MTDNFSNFYDFLDLKSPDLFPMEHNISQNDIEHTHQSNYEPSNDLLMSIENQQQPSQISASLSEHPSKHESLSSRSGYSTNYSIKNNTDDHIGEESSGNSDLNNHKWSQNPPICKKTINKNYEPIYDGNKHFNYEDDPIEYKKARKRIQNRESASRVRSRKKNYVEVVEQDVYSLKKDNSDLQLKNAALTAENNLLKQQITFLERMVMKSNPGSSLDFKTEGVKSSNFILPMQKRDEFSSESNCIEDGSPKEQMKGIEGFMRMSPNHPFKKHVTMLGVFTLLLCVFGFVAGDPVVNEGVSHGLSVEAFSKSLSMTLLSLKDEKVQPESDDTLSLYSRKMEQMLNKLYHIPRKTFSWATLKIAYHLSVSNVLWIRLCDRKTNRFQRKTKIFLIQFICYEIPFL